MTEDGEEYLEQWRRENPGEIPPEWGSLGEGFDELGNFWWMYDPVFKTAVKMRDARRSA